MGDEEKVKVTKLQTMTEAAANGIAPAVLADFEDLRARIDSGAFHLYEFNDGESYLITELVNSLEDEKRLVVHCYAGKNVRKLFPLLDVAAKNAGCKFILFQTHRPGIRRIGESFGYREIARLFRKDI